MPAGELLAERVAGVLHVQTGKTIAEISTAIGQPTVTHRAVRYAVRLLIEAGRAKRIGRKYQHFLVQAVVNEPSAATG